MKKKEGIHIKNCPVVGPGNVILYGLIIAKRY